MKKYLLALMLLCLICAFATGCSNNDAAQTGRDKDETQTDSDNAGKQDNPAAETKKVDVDLTVLSSTMVYAEVYNIVTNPKDYIGKTIKMSGTYYSSYFDKTSQFYHYVVNEDATACCSQGLEFIWKGTHTFPDDYPEDNSKIEVVGIFGRYDELGKTYYYLSVDDIVVLT